MSIASPSYRGYAVQTALMLSQEQKVVCDWQHYHLELTQQKQEEEEESNAQTTLEDAQNGVPLASCKVCHKPVSMRVVWCIHCGHPQPISAIS